MNNNKIQIGKEEYIVCTNEKNDEYLYKYDTEYGVGIKLIFSKNASTKNEILEMLTKQYIDKILLDRKI